MRLSRAVPHPSIRTHTGNKETRSKNTENKPSAKPRIEQGKKHTEAHRVRRARAWPLQSNNEKQTRPIRND